MEYGSSARAAAAARQAAVCARIVSCQHCRSCSPLACRPLPLAAAAGYFRSCCFRLLHCYCLRCIRSCCLLLPAAAAALCPRLAPAAEGLLLGDLGAATVEWRDTFDASQVLWGWWGRSGGGRL